MTPTVRPPRPEDFPAIVALGEAFDRALVGSGDWSEEDVAHDWRALADPERDAWLVEDGGAVVGYATFQDDGVGTFEADGYVHPDRFGHGIGATIVGLTEARAAQQLEAVALPRVVLQNVVLHSDGPARALLEGRGYRPVRHFLRMQIDMAEPPAAPVWPGGVTAAAFRPARMRRPSTPASTRRSRRSGASGPRRSPTGGRGSSRTRGSTPRSGPSPAPAARCAARRSAPPASSTWDS